MEENKTLIAEENLEENPVVVDEGEETSNIGLAVIAGSLVGVGAYFLIKKGIVPVAKKAAIWFENRYRNKKSSKDDADENVIILSEDAVEECDDEE